MNSEYAERGDALRMFVFAGPNGSGKSTINKAVLANPASTFSGDYINADDIAKSLLAEFPDYYTRNVRAAQIAEQRRQDALDNRQSFAFETVLSTPEKVALLSQAQAKGYEVSLVFVTLNDPQLNVQRVAARVQNGGHSVEPSAIIARYEKTMGLLASAIEHADKAIIFDNSGTAPVVVATKENRQLSIRDSEPDWVERYLRSPSRDRARSLDAISAVLDQIAAVKPAQALPAVVQNASAENGRSYSGKILAVASHHVLQQDSNSGVLTVHDLSLLAPMKFQLGQVVALQYAYDKGKIVVPPEKER